MPLLLTSGEVKYAVDFKWSPVVARTVSGRLTGSESAIANQVVRLVPFDSQGAGFGTEAAITLSGPDGAFTFVRVPPATIVSRPARRLLAKPRRPLPSHGDVQTWP
jgi:hypothetical protein